MMKFEFDFDKDQARFRPLELEIGVWAVFDVNSAYEVEGEAYITCWAGEAHDANKAIHLAKVAWGLKGLNLTS